MNNLTKGYVPQKTLHEQLRQVFEEKELIHRTIKQLSEREDELRDKLGEKKLLYNSIEHFLKVRQ